MSGDGRYRSAVFVWLIAQICLCAFNSVLVAFRLPRPMRATLFFAVTSAALSMIFIAVASWLIWRIRSRRRAFAVAIGAAIGLVTPALSFVLFFTIGLILHDLAHVDSSFMAAVFVVFIGTGLSLSGGGLLGGAWAGYVRSAAI